MMKLSSFAISVLVFASAGFSVAQAAPVGAPANAPWRHVEPQQADGMNLQIDFKTYRYQVENCYSCPGQEIAGPVWFNVSGPMVKPESKVRVIFLSFRKAPRDVNLPIEQKSVQVVDLSYYADKHAFSGAISQVPIYESGVGGTWNYYQEAAVVVDGKWYKKDATTNFQFDLFNSKKEY